MDLEIVGNTVYGCGFTGSPDFPVTTDAMVPTLATGLRAPFLVRLELDPGSPPTVNLSYGSFFATPTDGGYWAAMSSRSGELTFVGATNDSGYPTTPNGVPSLGGVEGVLTRCSVGGGGPSTLFSRGDTNNDDLFNIADAIYLLGILFPGPSGPNPLFCADAADANDDGNVNIADAIFSLQALFTPGAPQPPSPGTVPACGPDPTADALDCQQGC